MVMGPRKKNSRQRGSHTHGWGSKKKHRGAGNRGGVGRAGTGKRSDQKKPSVWAKTRYFGKYGFASHGVKQAPGITIRAVESSLETLVSKGHAEKKGDSYTVDLAKAGFGKLLATGSPSTKMTITVEKATPRAVEKIEAAGGTVAVSGASDDTESDSDDES